MDLEIFNTRGTDEEGHGKGKKKIRGPGTPAFRKLAEDSQQERPVIEGKAEEMPKEEEESDNIYQSNLVKSQCTDFLG